jgi:bis(5'-nucleosidyl)-tetraphosphatase
MIKEQTYGIIPLRKQDDKWQVLLVHHVKGHYWGFPKGHSNPGEAPKEAALRELFEETRLRVKSFLAVEPLHEAYDFYRTGLHIYKDVSYFLAEVEGEVTLQVAETQASLWINLSDAEETITFPQSKALVKQILTQIQD